MTRSAQKKHYLVFVDTNIFLDFYRVSEQDKGGLSLLRRVESNLGQMITSNQVEMEFLKNRQRVILDALKGIKAPDWSGMSAPAFLVDSQPSKGLSKHRDGITSHVRRLNTRIERILKDPVTQDPVFKSVQRILGCGEQWSLTRTHPLENKIRGLAQNRFALGYPPRKGNDLAIGDAINWEWILHCAAESGKHVVIVTRDSDYGAVHRAKPILNDWLKQEFRERTSSKRQIEITARLSEALKTARIGVSSQEEKEEEKFLERKNRSETDTLSPTLSAFEGPAAAWFREKISNEDSMRNFREFFQFLRELGDSSAGETDKDK